MITWQLRTEYADRLTVAHEHLEELDADLATLQDRYQAFVRARQASVHSYTGYDDGIRDCATAWRDAGARGPVAEAARAP